MLLGGSHYIFKADLGISAETRQLVEAVVNKMGAIDILVNNAGIYRPHPLATVSFEEWQDSWLKTLAVNLLGPANVTYWVSHQMIKQGGGRIVNISSRGAFRGEPEAPAYGASKAALNSMSQSLAQALAPHNIFISVVAPGWVDTDMAAESLNGPEGEQIRRQSPLNRVASADEVAHAVLFLASEGADFATGSILDVNGASYLRS
jgi:NAD(P)-dependent dehydrogenase (short-subunit alcohol dehydrogenase family)